MYPVYNSQCQTVTDTRTPFFSLVGTPFLVSGPHSNGDCLVNEPPHAPGTQTSRAESSQTAGSLRSAPVFSVAPIFSFRVDSTVTIIHRC